MIGKEDVNSAVLAAVEEALTAHELIKVKLQEGCLSDRHAVAQELAAASGSSVVQVLGRIILLFRPAKEPQIELPGS